MQEVEVKISLVMRIYWAWIWRTALLSMTLGFVLGVVIGLFGRMFGIDAGTVYLVSGSAGVILGIASSIKMFSKVLNMRFGKYRIAVIED